MKCYTCSLTVRTRQLVIADMAHGRMHFDLKGRPLLIYTPYLHTPTTLDLSGRELSVSFLEVNAFMNALDLPDYQVCINFGRWCNHAHVHWKIRADERTILALRARHFQRAGSCTLAPPPLQSGTDHERHRGQGDRECVPEEVRDSPQGHAAAGGACEEGVEEPI